MKNIHIPEPCSENWNKMTPTEKGAFCQKCALEVIDFTSKSGDEIRDILALKIGSRVCGRIEPKQLDELNDDFLVWQSNSRQSFNRAWIFSLLVVFGMTLFSCEEDGAPVMRSIQKTAQTFLTNLPKDIDVAPSKTIDAESITPPTINFSEITTEIEPKPEIAEVMEELEEVKVADKISRVEERNCDYMLGGIEYTEVVTLGDMAMSPVYIQHLTDINGAESPQKKLSGLTYPNPASNQTTLKVEMPSDNDIEIQLFTMNGQHIRSIHSGRLDEGETEFPIDLTGLETGSYLIIIYSDGEKETVKFSKI